MPCGGTKWSPRSSSQTRQVFERELVPLQRELILEKDLRQIPWPCPIQRIGVWVEFGVLQCLNVLASLMPPSFRRFGGDYRVCCCASFHIECASVISHHASYPQDRYPSEVSQEADLCSPGESEGRDGSNKQLKRFNVFRNWFGYNKVSSHRFVACRS